MVENYESIGAQYSRKLELYEKIVLQYCGAERNKKLAFTLWYAGKVI